MPESDNGNSFYMKIHYADGIEDVSEEEIRLIASHITELLKLMLEELAEKED